MKVLLPTTDNSLSHTEFGLQGAVKSGFLPSGSRKFQIFQKVCWVSNDIFCGFKFIFKVNSYLTRQYEMLDVVLYLGARKPRFSKNRVGCLIIFFCGSEFILEVNCCLTHQY